MTDDELVDPEVALLGACLINSSHVALLPDALPDLTPRHRTIARAMIDTANGRDCPDLVALRQHLGAEWDQIGGHAYLADLARGSTRSTNAPYYAALIRRRGSTRAALGHLQAAQDAIHGGDTNSTAADLIESARHDLDAAAGHRALVPIDLRACLEHDPIEAPWIVPYWLAASDRVVIGAQPEFGKSYILLDLALALATGQPFLGQTVTKTQRVTIVDEENPRIQDEKRLQYLMRGRSITADQAAALPLRCIVKSGLDADLATLRHELDAHPADWLFLDSMIRFIGGKDESSSSEVSAWFKDFLGVLEREHGVSIVLLHHIRKPGQGPLGKESDPLFALRGSGDIGGWPDCIWAGEKDGASRKLSVVKSRWLTEGQKRHVFLDLEEGNPPGSSRLVATEETESANTFVGSRLNAAGATGILRVDLIGDYAQTVGCGKATADRAVSRALWEMRRGGTLVDRKEGRSKRYFLREYAAADRAG